MAEYIEREAFVEQKRKQYCEDCDRRKGMKNGKYKTLYEIGEAPCRACGMDDMLNDVEDFPAADVREVKKSKWFDGACVSCGFKPMLDYEYDTVYDDHNGYRWNYCPNCGADMREES